ncbi:hypothetical protein [Chondromyces crocatus]|uniref:Uncharacterized protein n=1 Tax=Chondromyces crocatus TaxID=52 RepID=A0A0K1EEC8_CHOCO|nr:hypothetical protein [Chondromyces crocatus]AKT39221.1 uncharacterized protein CMC5_033700 [Chondromyces crocatus]
MSREFRVTIASPPDREKLVAEIFFGDEQVAEIHQESDELQIEIYMHSSGKPWMLPYVDFMKAMSKARQRLVGGDL